MVKVKVPFVSTHHTHRVNNNLQLLGAIVHLKPQKQSNAKANMSTVSNAISGLTTREAITDALYRAVVGLDTADETMFDSAFTSEGVLEISGNKMTGIEALHTGCFDYVGKKLDTTHFINNVRIEVAEGASSAKVTASALAQHYRGGEGKTPGAQRLLAGSLYKVDAVKDDKDGQWKIAYWNLEPVWLEGDYSILSPEN